MGTVVVFGGYIVARKHLKTHFSHPLHVNTVECTLVMHVFYRQIRRIVQGATDHFVCTQKFLLFDFEESRRIFPWKIQNHQVT